MFRRFLENSEMPDLGLEVFSIEKILIKELLSIELKVNYRPCFVWYLSASYLSFSSQCLIRIVSEKIIQGYKISQMPPYIFQLTLMVAGLFYR